MKSSSAVKDYNSGPIKVREWWPPLDSAEAVASRAEYGGASERAGSGTAEREEKQ